MSEPIKFTDVEGATWDIRAGTGGYVGINCKPDPEAFSAGVCIPLDNARELATAILTALNHARHAQAAARGGGIVPGNVTATTTTTNAARLGGEDEG